MNLYCVIYFTGEYEDYNEETLALFLTEDEANDHVNELEEAYSDWDEEDKNDMCYNYQKQDWSIDKPYDLYIDYNGPFFVTRPIPVKSPELFATLTDKYPELLL